VHLGRRGRKRQPTVFTCTLTLDSGETVEIGRSGGFGSSILPGYGAFVEGLHEALIPHRDAIVFRAGMSAWMLALNGLPFAALGVLGALMAIPVLTLWGLMDLAEYASGDTTGAVLGAVGIVVFLGSAAFLLVVPVGVVMWLSRPITYAPDALPAFYIPSDP
jgi:hypothetical protein